MASSSKDSLGIPTNTVWNISLSHCWCAHYQSINLQKDKLWIIIFPSLNNYKSTFNMPILQLHSSRNNHDFPPWLQWFPPFPHTLSRRSSYLISKTIDLHHIVLHQLWLLDIYSAIGLSFMCHYSNYRKSSFLGFKFQV
jgi:hypothetical protein